VERALRCDAGGIAGLVRLLTEYGEAVEADLQRFYGVDLRDLWRPGGSLTWRRLRALVVSLPVESALSAALPDRDADDDTPAPRPRWSHTDHLLADVFDAVTAGNWQRAGDPKAPRPQPYPRPRGAAPAARRGLSSEQRRELRRRTGRTESEEVAS